MRIHRALATLSVLAVAVACGAADGDGAGGTRPSQRPTPTPAPADTPRGDPADVAPAFPESTADQTADNAGEWDLELVDVRLAGHGGFDRIVLEFTGSGVPGWAVGYVAEAVLEGSGETVPLAGDAILDIYASGTTWAGSAGDRDTVRQLEPGSGDVVAAVHVSGTFEGYTQVLVGIDGGAVPFLAFALTDPSRLVVDVVDDGAG